MRNSTLASPRPSSADAIAAAELRALKEERLRRLEAEEKASETLLEYVPRVSPGFLSPEHLAQVADLFDRIRRGERVRACISVPTQHGKTELVLHGIAQILGQHPTWPVIYSTYQKEQTNDKSHRCRAIARAAGVDLAADRQNLSMWRTASGGGCLFTSIDGPGSGQPAVLGVIDDPYKNREAALSEATRRAVRSHLSSVILQRGQEGMSVLVIHTRWCDPDLIGEIEVGAFGPGWEVINLPMLGELDARGKLVPSPRPYTTATHVLNPRRELPDGRSFGWTLAGAVEHLCNTPEAEAEAMLQGKPRRSVDGALWTWEHIVPWRVAQAPSLSRCEVYVDPNQSDEARAAKADDAGVVTIARGADGRGYVLDDASAHAGVKGWVGRAVASYRKHKAHSICAESDGGGALIEEAVNGWLLQEALDKTRATGRHHEPEKILVRLVRVGARGDKRGRAETVRELYGEPLTGRPSVVSHVGPGFAHLEHTMTHHDYATSRISPGALDALSLGLTELMLQGTTPAISPEAVRKLAAGARGLFTPRS